MTESRDQLGTLHKFPAPPRRIVSLVPSITELLCDLGLRDRLVGCTKFCVHPADLRGSITKVGGTKQVHYDRIRVLQPDLIVANMEENTREMVEQLRGWCPVWVSRIGNVPEAEEMIRAFGALFDRAARATEIIAANRAGLARYAKPDRGTALYFIWQKPWMAAAGDTYISRVMAALGYHNLLNAAIRYPELSAERIEVLRPDHILLSSEPFPFAEKHRRELSERFPHARVALVDGEFFSWYGSRLGKIENLEL